MSCSATGSRACSLALLLLAACGEPPETAPGTDDDHLLRFEALDVDDLAMVTWFGFLPGSAAEALVLEKNGRLVHLRLDGDEAEPLGSLQVPVHSDMACGLLTLAFDPGFADNHHLFVSSCRDAQTLAIDRITFDPTDYAASAASRVTVLEVGDPEATEPGHNVGSMGFDATGALWAVLGDKRRGDNAQDRSTMLGSLIRVVPGADGGYTPAPDNPFVGQPGVAPEIFAYGLRSPWRALVDDRGRWVVGDVGAADVEEIDVVAAAGTNLGWSTHEGPCTGACDGVVDPVVHWTHDEISTYMLDDPDVVPTESRVAWVGTQVLPQAGDPYGGRLDGRILFGDYCLGYVRGLVLDDAGAVSVDEHLGHLPLSVAWDRAGDGFLYVATFGQCRVHSLDETSPPESRLYRAVLAE